MKRTHARTMVAALATVGVGATASVAHGQTFVTNRTTGITYSPLSTNATRLSNDSNDGEYTVNSPFPIKFYDQTVTSLRVGDNGMIQLPASGQQISATNAVPGGSASPNGWVAALWDDLRIFPNGELSWEVAGSAPDRTLSVEWRNVSGCCTQGSADVTFKVVFYEGPAMRIDIEYGALSQTTRDFTATMAMEDASGGRVLDFTPTACADSCGNADVTALSNTRVEVRPAPTPELTGSFVSAPRGALTGQTVTATLTLTNLGTDTATLTQSALWVSADTTFDETTDLEVWSTTRDLPFGDTTVMATVTVPAVPAGDYTLFLVVDGPDDWSEPDESNNIIEAPQLFATAPDLSVGAVRVTNPNGVNAGETISYEVTINNDGAPYADVVSVELRASVDQVYTPAADPVVFPTTAVLTGQVSETVTVSGPLSSLNPGAYFSVAIVDATSALDEVDETNNVGISADTFDTGPDFAVGALAIPTEVAPGARGTFVTRIDNRSVPYTGTVEVRLIASEDDVLDPLDTPIDTFTVTFNGETEVSDSRSVELPVSLPPNRYFVFAVVDPDANVDERDENNNVRISDSTLINAVDFSVANVRVSPATIEVGLEMTVTAEFFNTGLPFTGNVPFTILLSEDDVFDVGDQAIFRSFVFFTGVAATGPQTFRFPASSLPPARQFDPGDYTVIVVIDRDSTGASRFAEASEVNNEANGNTSLRLLGADLLAVDMTVGSPAFIGGDLTITLTIENNGQAAARGFRYAYYLSDNQIIRTSDLRIFLSNAVTLDVGETQSFTDVVPVPTLTSTVSAFVGVLIDIFSQVPENSDNNNSAVAEVILPSGNNIGLQPVDFLLPIPDLSIRIAETPTVAAAGEDIAITRLLINDGVAPAIDFRYTYYLSTNPTISSADDIPIFTGTASVLDGQDDFGIDIFTLPAGLQAANYYVGAIVDPDDDIDEILEDNNTFTGPQIPVFPTTIQFATRELPDGVVGVPYEVGVYAAGAPITLTFEIVEGSAPDGLILDENTGILSGTPTLEGVFELTVRARAGTAFADQEFVIRVTAPTTVLQIATDALPPAFVGRPYSAQLVGVGGQVPYVWSVVGDLPEGLSLSEDGVLSGTPETPGVIPLLFRVRDDVDDNATQEINLNIVSGAQVLQIQQTLLFPAEVGVPYCDPEPVSFVVENGLPPYSWSTISDPPPGMSVSPDGNLCGTPTTAGNFSFTVRVQDSTGTFDTSLFVLAVDDGGGVAISTFSLPEGDIDEPYVNDDGGVVRLTAIEGTEPYTWRLVEGAGAPAMGISLTEGGTLTGTPTESGVFAFLVQVTDAQMRTDTQPLSMLVNASPQPSTLDPGSGCSCSAAEEQDMKTPWTSLAIMGALAVFFGLRRKKNLAGLLAALIVVGATSIADAQTGSTITIRREAITYVPLSGATTLAAATSDDNEYDVNSPFPIKFYDNTYTSIRVGDNGAILFPAAGQQVSTGNAFPGTGTPNNYIAPLWDDLFIAGSGSLVWTVEGTAPRRRLIVEWRNVSGCCTAGNWDVTFRVVFFEGPVMNLNVEYGSLTQASRNFSATMAMEDSAGQNIIQFAMRNCNSSCNNADVTAMSNMRVVVTEDAGPDLSAAGIVAPEFAFLGAQTRLPVNVFNLHANPIGPFAITIEASSTADFAAPEAIGTSGGFVAPPFQVSTFDVIAVPPTRFGTNPIFVRATVDSDGTVAEVNENNNVFTAVDPIRLIPGAPDIAIVRVDPEARMADAGDTITVVTRIQNVGSDPVSDAVVSLRLSGNPVISRQDVTLGNGDIMVTLAPNETITTTTSVDIPAETNSGTYYVGALADPDDLVDELSEVNNSLSAFDAITVTGASLAVTTTTLPRATLRVPYVALIEAVGASSDATWSVVQGDLPTGLGLVANSGEIFGRPIRVETQTFTVQVESNGATATAELTLSVSDPTEPLTIVNRAVPPAVVGQEYTFPFIATGGTVTDGLTWSATGLPEGISIQEDDGILFGTPRVAGTNPFTLTVNNGVEEANRNLTFEVVDNSNLLIVPSALSTATWGESYTAQLQAQGGIPPYTWILESGQLPTGMSLSATGELSGAPEQVGVFRFVVEARDSAPGNRAARDKNGFDLTVVDASGFTISTASLEPAFVDQGYDQSIAATGGRQPYQWTLQEGRIPTGLVGEVDPSTGEYRIRGEPTEIGVSNLLLVVTDAQNRSAVRAFALQVLEDRPNPSSSPTDPSGCRAVGAGSVSPLAALALVLFGLFIRRRRAQ